MRSMVEGADARRRQWSSRIARKDVRTAAKWFPAQSREVGGVQGVTLAGV